MSSFQGKIMTFEEFLRLPDPPDGHYELHHSEVVLMPPRKRQHVKIQQVLLELFLPLTHGKGFVTIEFPFRPEPEYEAWQADLAFVVKGRWEKDDADYFSGAPDLVIEVLSYTNTAVELVDRQDECLSNGCSAFWTVDPMRWLAFVTTPDHRTLTFDTSMSIPLPEPLSGTIPVAAIFA
jgi:Uma2 family endonuclease